MAVKYSKEYLREFALSKKADTGKFPLSNHWALKDGFPVSYGSLVKLFGSYNNFRDFCDESHKKRTEIISLEWIKNNSTITDMQCWEYNKDNSEEYKRIKYSEQNFLSHRLTYILKNGPITDNLVIRHMCHNKKCCNPDHLKIGTHTDNRNDTVNKVVTNVNANLMRKLLTNCKTLESRTEFYLSKSVPINLDCLTLDIIKLHTSGYYRVEFKNKPYYLHRLILAHKISKNYDSVDITRHTCNNKYCINPLHLIEGSRRDNALDVLNSKRNL